MMRRRLARRSDQRGMTLVETMLALFLSSLMMLPMFGWAAIAMKEQVNTQQRNVNGSSLGLLRTYFVNDVTTASSATANAGEDSCAANDKGARSLLRLQMGPSIVSYALVPTESGSQSLWRTQCSGAEPTERVELVADVIDAGTSASCDTSAELARAAITAGLVDEGKDAKNKEKPVSAFAAGDDSCRRVSLQVTTAELDQVALTASLRTGSSSVVAGDPPVAVAAASPTSGPRRLTVQFSSKDSSDPDDEALSFAWDFGDGSSSTQANPLKSYVVVGSFTATLTVTNESGLTSSASVAISVSDNVPVAAIAAPVNGTTTYRGAEVAFSSAGSNDDKDKEFGSSIVGYAWDFGDGTTSTEANPKKTYSAISPAAGYTVRLAVFDTAGQTATAEIKVIVANRLPTATIVASTTSGVVPLTVDFSSIVVDETTLSPNPALTYAWNFGDGGTSTLADPPPRTYTTTGTRSVTLAVTDDQGATATATQTITVGAPLLAAPTGLRFVRSGTAVGTRNMDLSWTARTGATLYQVRLVCESCPDTHSADSATTSVRVNGLRNERTWYLAAVRARNSTGDWGPWSSNVRVRS
jgi:PKD repeat protein